MNRLSLLFLLTVLLTACSVESTDIETWKGTQNGPKKIAGVLIDPTMPIQLRSQAALALMEINRTDLFIEGFRKIESADADVLILAAAPLFAGAMNPEKKDPGPSESSLTPEQIRAKDGLYLMLDFSGASSRPAVEKALIQWCTEGNYSVRAVSGYNLRIIAKKIGPAAALALAGRLSTEQSALRDIAELIREMNDPRALETASSNLVDVLRKNPDAITKVQLETAAIIGGAPVSELLLKNATDIKTGTELQRLSLRAFSVGVDKKSITATPADLNQLIAVATDSNFDRIHREETWMTISQIQMPLAVEKIAELLVSEEFFFKLVGARLLLRIDPDTWLPKILKTPLLATNQAEIEDFIDLLCRFPRTASVLAPLARDKNLLARAFALSALSVIGTKAQLSELESIAADPATANTRLPEGFSSKTTGEAARAAIDAIMKKG